MTSMFQDFFADDPESNDKSIDWHVPFAPLGNVQGHNGLILRVTEQDFAFKLGQDHFGVRASSLGEQCFFQHKELPGNGQFTRIHEVRIVDGVFPGLGFYEPDSVGRWSRLRKKILAIDSVVKFSYDGSDWYFEWDLDIGSYPRSVQKFSQAFFGAIEVKAPMLLRNWMAPDYTSVPKAVPAQYDVRSLFSFEDGEAEIGFGGNANQWKVVWRPSKFRFEITSNSKKRFLSARILYGRFVSNQIAVGIANLIDPSEGGKRPVSTIEVDLGKYNTSSAVQTSLRLVGRDAQRREWKSVELKRLVSPSLFLQLVNPLSPPGSGVPFKDLAYRYFLSTSGQLDFCWGNQSTEKNEWLSRVKLQKATFGVSRTGSVWRSYALATVVDKPHTTTYLRGQLTVSRLTEASPLEIQLLGDAFEKFSAPLALHKQSFSVSGVDSALLKFRNTFLSLRLIDQAGDQASDQKNQSQFIGGSAPRWSLYAPLSNAQFETLRSADLMSLKFGFRGLSLLQRSRSSSLVRTSCNVEPILIANLPPQHIAEQAFFGDIKPNTSKEILVVKVSPDGTRKKKYNKLTDLDPDHGKKKRHDEDFKKQNFLAEARLSGESRIAFSLERHYHSNCEENGGYVALDFGLGTLLNWGEYGTIIAPAALPANADIDSQLEVIGIDSSAGEFDSEDLLHGITQKLKAPGPAQTAIELPYRLTISPSYQTSSSGSENSRGGQQQSWQQSEPVKDRDRQALWHTTYVSKGRPADYRALWSPDFNPDYFNPELYEDEPKHNHSAPWSSDPEVPFRSSTDRRDRHELVSLTSAFGLPSLLKISPSSGDSVKNRAEPSVRLPGIANARLDSEEGVYIPAPFSKADITLTSLGANAYLEGNWEPPAAITGKWPALNVERFQTETVLGNDIKTEVLYKGFLMPIGLRASLIKITERQFKPDEKHGDGAGVAVLIQRMYIQISKPDKAYPAHGQPFAGRAWPCDTLTMLTRRSPAISDPTSPQWGDRLGKAGQLKLAKGSAFFPVRYDSANPVLFEYKLKGVDGVVRSPLMFVDNTAAHHPLSCEQAMSFYNNLKLGFATTNKPATPIQLRAALFGSQRVDYAEPLKAGDTSFETNRWILACQPREIDQDEPKSNTAFSMDGIMEGLDQPPFYPRVARAYIVAQSISALTGKPGTETGVSFDDTYLRYKFDSKLNPGEIYLKIAEKPPALDVSSNGDAAGGLAKPNLQVAALSRKTGVVGGSRGDALSEPDAISMVATARSGDVSIDSSGYEDALKGTFNPQEFFGGELLEAKLLGLIRLKDIIQAGSMLTDAPRLIEQVESGISEQIAAKFGSNEYRAFVNEIVEDLIIPIEEVVSTITGKLSELFKDENEKEQFADELDFAVLYPELVTALQDLSESLKKARSELSSTKLERLWEQGQVKTVLSKTLGAFSSILKSGKRLQKEVERIAQDPVPPLVADFIDELKRKIALIPSLLKVIQAELGEMIQQQVQQLRLDLEQRVKHAIQSAAKAGFHRFDYINELFHQLFGRSLVVKVDDTVVVNSFDLTDPKGRDLQHMQNSLLYPVLGEPIYKAYVALLRIEESKQLKLKEIGAAIVETFTAFSELEAYRELYQRLSKNADEFLARIFTKVLQLLATDLDKGAEEISKHLKIVATELKNVESIETAKIEPPFARQKLEQLQIQSRHLHQQVAGYLFDMERFRRDLKCISTNKPDIKWSRYFTQMQAARANSLTSIRGLITQLIESARLLESSDVSLTGGAEVAREDALAAIRKYVRELALLSTSLSFAYGRKKGEVIDFINGNITNSKIIPDRMKTSIKEVLMQAASLQQKVDSARSNLKADYRSAEGIVDGLISYQRTVEKRLFGYLLTLRKSTEDVFFEALYSELAPLGSFLADILIQADSKALEAHDAILGLINKSDSAEEILRLVLRDVWFDALTDDGDGSLYNVLGDEKAALVVAKGKLDEGKKEKLPSAYETLAHIKKPAVIAHVDFMLELISTLLEGDLSKVFVDIDEISENLERALLALIPAKASYGYDWSTELAAFPSGASDGEALFRMAPEETGDDFKKLRNSGIKTEDSVGNELKNLTICAGGSYHFLTKETEFDIEALLQGFIVNLFPGFELATITFAGARFTSGASEGSDFDIKIAKVEIGEKLQYLKQLADMLAPSNGPYILPRITPPGIEAGFRLSKSSIPFGSMMLYDLKLGVSCELPFDDRPAQFRFYLSSPSRPFIISSPPYGGGGSVQLISQAGRMVDFMATFEFGAYARINFGPLRGRGSVSTGIYLRKSSAQQAYLRGFVQAYGEGSLACFSVAVHIYVSVHMRGSDMWGQAGYSFSFKVGFIKVRYGFTASYTIRGSGSSGGAQLKAFLELADDVSGFVEPWWVLLWRKGANKDLALVRAIIDSSLDEDVLLEKRRDLVDQIVKTIGQEEERIEQARVGRLEEGYAFGLNFESHQNGYRTLYDLEVLD